MNRKKSRVIVNPGRKRGLIWPALALVLAFACAAAGCGKKKTDEVEAIRAAGTLQVAIVETGGQYTRKEGEKLAGLEPDLAEFIADALKVEAVYQVCSREEALQKLTLGEADIALGCIHGEGSLSSDYLLTTSYGKGWLYAVTKTGDYALTVGSFKNSSVGVEKGLNEETRGLLYRAEGIRITDYSSSEEAARAIKEDSIRAYLCREEQARTLLEDPALQVQNIANLDPEEFVILAPKSSQTLVNGMNTLIQQFLENR